MVGQKLYEIKIKSLKWLIDLILTYYILLNDLKWKKN